MGLRSTCNNSGLATTPAAYTTAEIFHRGEPGDRLPRVQVSNLEQHCWWEPQTWATGCLLSSSYVFQKPGSLLHRRAQIKKNIQLRFFCLREVIHWEKNDQQISSHHCEWRWPWNSVSASVQQDFRFSKLLCLNAASSTEIRQLLQLSNSNLKMQTLTKLKTCLHKNRNSAWFCYLSFLEVIYYCTVHSLGFCTNKYVKINVTLLERLQIENFKFN